MPASTVASNSSSTSLPPPHDGSTWTPWSLGQRAQVVDGLRGVHLATDGVGHQVDHPPLRPRRGEVDGLPTDLDDGRAEGVAGGLHDQRLGEVHHVGDVGVGLVGLHHRELGVVARREALVAEDPADLEHAVHAADDQPLEVQLEGDAQVQRHVEGVVVGDERLGVGAAGVDVHDRRLDLGVATVTERAAEAGDDLVADVEGAAGLGVDDEVDVALAVPRVRVGQPVPLVGQRAQRLGQQRQVVDLDRQLPGPGRHHGAGDADPVAAVERLDGGEPVVADDGLGHEQLDLGATLGDGREDQLAGVALEHDAPGDGDPGVGLGAGVEVGPLGAQGGDAVGPVEAVRVRLDAGGPEVVDLTLPAHPLGRQPAARRAADRRRPCVRPWPGTVTRVGLATPPGGGIGAAAVA